MRTRNPHQAALKAWATRRMRSGGSDAARKAHAVEQLKRDLQGIEMKKAVEIGAPRLHGKWDAVRGGRLVTQGEIQAMADRFVANMKKKKTKPPSLPSASASDKPVVIRGVAGQDFRTKSGKVFQSRFAAKSKKAIPAMLKELERRGYKGERLIADLGTHFAVYFNPR